MLNFEFVAVHVCQVAEKWSVTAEHVCMYVCMYVRTHAHTCVGVYTYAGMPHTPSFSRACVRACVRVCVCAYVREWKHACMHAINLYLDKMYNCNLFKQFFSLCICLMLNYPMFNLNFTHTHTHNGGRGEVFFMIAFNHNWHVPFHKWDQEITYHGLFSFLQCYQLEKMSRKWKTNVAICTACRQAICSHCCQSFFNM